jgi:probable F420-dependent oxidoreductase
MGHARTFRFGVQCSSPPSASAGSWAALARRCEELGYATLTVADHFDDQLAPVPAIMAAADATTTLRVGALVFGNDYRHPVVLAKEAATLDVLSGGRFELGLGAGWMSSDYERAGMTLDRPGVRIDRMVEALEVITRLWADEPCSFRGEHYAVEGLDGLPKPVQAPRPPILIGGGGRRVLTVAAQWADIVGINFALAKGVIDASAGPNGTAEATEEKIGWIKEAAGPRFDDIELQVRVHLAIVTDDRVGTAEALAGGFGLTPEQALQSPHALAGTVEQITDDLLERRDRYGISFIGIGLDAMEAIAPVVARLAGS